MTGYYVVIDEAPPYKSEIFELPPNLAQDEAIIFMHGMMFGDNWCPGTDHAIFVDSDGNGCVAVHEEGDVVSTS